MGDEAFVAARQSTDQPQPTGMIWIPGGTFRMGTDRHYPEEAPAHRVTVSGFWIDRTPVTNRQFRKFINETPPAARHAQPIATSASHVGFRCVLRRAT